MKGFELDEKGDVVIQNQKINLVYDDTLIRQKIRTVLGTNQGEWVFNTSEGIKFRSILVKNPDSDVIQSEILQGLRQVDDTFYLETFQAELTGQRVLQITFTARNEAGMEVKEAIEWR